MKKTKHRCDSHDLPPYIIVLSFKFRYLQIGKQVFS